MVGRSMMWRVHAFAAVVIAAACSGCTTMMGPAGGSDTSRAAEPPQSWESAVLFQFRDSLSDPHARFAARVEFRGDGAVPQNVTGADVYVTESNLLRTPWYRMRILGNAPERQMVLRVVLEHATGEHTEAEYPLTIKRDEFYYVSLGIGTREPAQPHRIDVMHELRSYPVPIAARRLASDSLWIGYYTRGRYCFSCPG
jgi:hypothetical protein